MITQNDAETIHDKIMRLSLCQRVRLAALLLEKHQYELAHHLLDRATAQAWSLLMGAKTNARHHQDLG